MSKFEVGKVYACDTANFCINDFYNTSGKTNVEIRYETIGTHYGMTLLKCVELGDKKVFQEYFTKNRVVSYSPLNSKVYNLTNENLFDVKKQILNSDLIYIDEDNILVINDEILDRLSTSLKDNTIGLAIEREVSRSRRNLYDAYNRTYLELLREALRLAEAENIVRDFEDKPKTFKKEYTC